MNIIEGHGLIRGFYNLLRNKAKMPNGYATQNILWIMYKGEF